MEQSIKSKYFTCPFINSRLITKTGYVNKTQGLGAMQRCKSCQNPARSGWRVAVENAHSVLVGRSVAARIHAKGLKVLEPVTKRGRPWQADALKGIDRTATLGLRRMESGMLSSLVLRLRLASRRCGDCGGVTTANAVDLVYFPASAKEK